jgi:hypothetical protein
MAYGPPPNSPPPFPTPGPDAGSTSGSGIWRGAVAVVLGVVGCVAPLLPIDLTGVREYLAFPFGLVGLVLAAVTATAYRRGRPLAITGAVLCGLALLLGLAMVAGHARNHSEGAAPRVVPVAQHATTSGTPAAANGRRTT